MELPKELRQLQQMHQERQEWASHHYPVTEQGLLARFHPRAKHPPQKPPPAEEDNQRLTAPLKRENVQSPASAKPAQSPPSAPEPKGVFSVGVNASPVREFSPCPLPAMGRGFLLQLPQAQNPGGSPEVRPGAKPPHHGFSPSPTKSAPGPSIDLSSLTPQSLSSSLRQSFKSFRN